MSENEDKSIAKSARLYYAYLRWRFNDLITSGLKLESNPETLHRVRMINVLAALIAIFFFAFAIPYAINGNHTSSAILGISAAAMIAVMVFLRFSRNLTAAAAMTCGAAFFACLTRLHYAPPESYGYLWSLMIPLLTVFTLGHRIGGAVSLVYIAMAAVAIYLPDNPLMTAEYPPRFRIRLLMTLFGILSAAYYVEYARTRATRALHSSDHRFQSLIENSASVYAIVALDGTVLYESPSLKGVYGYDPEELVGTNIIEQVHPDDREEAIKKLTHLVQNPGQVETVETRYRHRDGSWRDIEVSGVSLLHDPDVGGLVLTSHDITERKSAEREIRKINASLEEGIRERTEALGQSEERLRQSEKMKAIGQLAGGIAHDFNNQLTAILSCLEMLRRNRKEDARASSALEAAATAARRAADLTSQLLAFARKSSGLTEPVDLRAIVREVISLLEHSIDKRIGIREAMSEDSHVVLGDSAQLHSALLNLAINARDAMPDGGKILFSSRLATLDRTRCETEGLDLEPGRYLLLSVSDTGRGLTPEVRRQIFEPFFTTKPAGEGTGMGLAAVYGTAQLHGGTVTVESEPGNGAVFTLYLPVDPDAGEEPHTPVPPPPIEDKSLRVMVVDDEPVVRETVVLTLEELGHQVVACKDGASAIEIYRQRWRDLDVVVLDMMMPGLSGRETFLALKAINPAIRVLLASGYSANQEAEATLADGALGFLQKPFRLNDLAQRLIDTTR